MGKTGKDKHAEAQSAMEYLMTYGWAILIIAIALVVLFQFGLFSSTTFTGKAAPGLCSVYRPDGPGTINFISTEGTCNNEIPQYVASFDGSSLISASSSIPQMSSITMTAWIYMPVIPGNNAGIVGLTPNYCGALSMFPNGGCNIQACMDAVNPATQAAIDSATCVSTNKWYFVAVYSNQDTKIFGVYVDGHSTNSTFSGNTISANEISIGEFESQGAYFNGYISNIQIYNTALSSNNINALYLEGIGGAPVDLHNLVGWWPLNGNANDYSGNNNKGQINGGVTFTSSWESGYTQP